MDHLYSPSYMLVLPPSVSGSHTTSYNCQLRGLLAAGQCRQATWFFEVIPEKTLKKYIFFEKLRCSVDVKASYKLFGLQGVPYWSRRAIL